MQKIEILGIDGVLKINQIYSGWRGVLGNNPPQAPSLLIYVHNIYLVLVKISAPLPKILMFMFGFASHANNAN